MGTKTIITVCLGLHDIIPLLNRTETRKSLGIADEHHDGTWACGFPPIKDYKKHLEVWLFL